MQDNKNWLVDLACLGPVKAVPQGNGTVASAIAVAIAPWVFMPLPIVGRIIVLCFLFWLGVHAASHAEKHLQQKDPGCIVIDEVFGQWVTLLPFVSLGFWGYLIAFILFRAFDIFKPWPVCMAEKYSRGLGIMADDGVAGLYAALSTALLLWLF